MSPPMERRVSRYRERQYQLAAQKHNQEFLKHDYHQQTAKYFERACRNAQQYDSWNNRNLDPKGELAKARKTEKLLVRRNKLKTLLKEEEETYKREIEEKQQVKSRAEDTSLEALKQKLKEKRAEQCLYLPRTYRRYQSHFVSPTVSASSRCSTLKDTNLQYFRPCRDSTNFHHQNERHPPYRSSRMSEDSSKISREQEHLETEQEISGHPSSDYVNDPSMHNSRFSARYARKSLENTNVRTEGREDGPSVTFSRSSISAGSPSHKHAHLIDETEVQGDNKENRGEDSRPSSREEAVHPKDYMRYENGVEKSLERFNKNDDSRPTDASEEIAIARERDEVDRHNAKEDQAARDDRTKGNQQFEVEKSMPWLRMDPGDKNLSKQMFMYLTHKELKCKIDDLARRELHACNKHCWDEALRLRDMRNRLELIREKELYRMKNLELDEDTRKMGMINIDKRETELAERENICTDSTMYSEDAKALWKKWVHEDDRSVITDACKQREKLMSSLEDEWQNLAIRDKDRISRTYENVMGESDVQEEHKLATAFNVARMKSFSGSAK